MTREQILAQIETNDFNKIVELSEAYSKDTAEPIKEYDPYQHDVTDPVKRPDRIVKSSYNPIKKDPITGKEIFRETIDKVTRIILAIQQDIVHGASGVLCSNPIKLINESKDAIQSLLDCWDYNKLDFKTTSIFEAMISQTESAELWYKKDDKFKFITLSPANADSLYPVFDNYGDMVAFGRSYVSKQIINDAIEDVTHYEIYTDKLVYIFDDNQKEVTSTEHGFKKIPVIYYSQPKTEWYIVQPLIDHLEKILSNLGDTNIRFSNPAVVAESEVTTLPTSTEQAKFFQIKNANQPGAKGGLYYLTWDNVIDSLKFEFETLMNMIYDLTQTIKMSASALKNAFGSAPSGYAIKLMFTAALWKASRHEENFGAGIQRRINLMKSFLNISDDIKCEPKFTYYLPVNELEQVKALSGAKDAGINSNETLVANSPFTTDAESEIEKIKEQGSDEGQPEPNTQSGARQNETNK